MQAGFVRLLDVVVARTVEIILGEIPRPKTSPTLVDNRCIPNDNVSVDHQTETGLSAARCRARITSLWQFQNVMSWKDPCTPFCDAPSKQLHRIDMDVHQGRLPQSPALASEEIHDAASCEPATNGGSCN